MAVRISRTWVGLIIGIIIVALLVLVGLSFAKQRGEQARRDEAVKIAQQNLESQSQGGALNEGDSGDKKGEEKPAGNNGNKAPEKTPTASELPQTGPVDGLLSLVAAAMLAFSATRYVASRRALLQSRSA
jgi:FtsZ-interacting cell division protein ZipA